MQLEPRNELAPLPLRRPLDSRRELGPERIRYPNLAARVEKPGRVRLILLHANLRFDERLVRVSTEVEARGRGRRAVLFVGERVARRPAARADEELPMCSRPQSPRQPR